MKLPVVVLEIVERCNCRCVMCDIWSSPGSRTMAPEEIASRLPELRELGVREVALSGGEPLLHPRFGELAQSLREAGLAVTLITTGLLLAAKRDEVAAGIDAVVVSLDGPEAIHDAIRRVPRAFARLAEGVAALRERAPTIPITARTVVQCGNAGHLAETVDSARELGLDGISFLAADVTSEAFARPGGWPAERRDEVAVPPEALAALAAELAAIADDDDGFVAENAAKLARIPRVFAAAAGLEAPSAPICNAPRVSAVVEVDGSVRPCFFHPAYGSWAGRSLADVVDAPEAAAFRDRLEVARDPICRRCVCWLHRDDRELETNSP